MRAAVKRFASIFFALSLAVFAAAHVGSPNVLFEGAAGPYPVRVIVRPPEVVPGLAEVIVRVNASDVSEVAIKPVFWRAGAKGAPAADAMKRVPGDAQSYSGQLWLMARGAYSVYVTVTGARGAGTAIVPVASLATGRLPLSRGLGAILVVLGLALVAGFLTIIRAASGEALVALGETFDAPRRRRANTIAAIAAPVMALLLFGGAKWWRAEDTTYQQSMYAAPAAMPTIVSDASHRTLRLDVRDTASFRAIYTPLIPDHGKLMHLFLIGAPGSNAFAHLHPVREDSTHAQRFDVEVPALPAGRYTLYGDILQENGLSLTVTNTVELPALAGPVTPSDADDAWSLAPAMAAAPSAVVPLGDGYTLQWTRTDGAIASKQALDLTFTVHDPTGAVASLQPYLGMASHAVIARDDGSVFIHLHPMGTVATTAQEVFSARDRGDTTARGRLRPGAIDSAGMQGMSMQMAGTLSFPYEFPKPGRYRMWVQVRPKDRVLTGAFDVDVR